MKRIEEKAKLLFYRIDHLYNNELEFKYTKKIMSQIESEISIDRDFFSKENIITRQKKIERLISAVTTSNRVVYELIKYEYQSPFGLFYDIFEKENIPDIAISNQLIKVQMSSTEFKNIYVPDKVKEGFAFFLEHFVNKIKFIDEKKLNVSNAIIDSSFGKYRFNIVHSSLNSFEGPIVTVRKHLQEVKASVKELDRSQYENSLGVSKQIIDKLKEYSGKSICIFGEPGSGKTTLLRYLVSHKLEEKRNLCVIEDTPELRLPVNISLVTNREYTIKDLFTAALRQNPSHLIIGETRTDEIVDIMEAGLTFSVGTTIHANSFEKAIERIYFMSRPRGLNKNDIEDLISASFEMFVFMDKRKIKGIWIRNQNNSGDIYSKYDKLELNHEEILEGVEIA